MKRPSVVVVTRRTIRKNKYIDYVGEFHLALLIRLGILLRPRQAEVPSCLPCTQEGTRWRLRRQAPDSSAKRSEKNCRFLGYVADRNCLTSYAEVRCTAMCRRKRSLASSISISPTMTPIAIRFPSSPEVRCRSGTGKKY